MKQALIALVVFAVGAGAGALVLNALDGPDGERQARQAEKTTHELQTLRLKGADDSNRIAELLAELAKLRAQLAEATKPEESPWPNDSVAAVERLLQDAYSDNNVDWLLEVIERLLMMGEKGFPVLRRLIEDIAFKGKFSTNSSDSATLRSVVWSTVMFSAPASLSGRSPVQYWS